MNVHVIRILPERKIQYYFDDIPQERFHKQRS